MDPRLSPFAALCLLLAACASRPLPQASAASLEPPPLFTFESSEWVNLHHFLLAESKAKEPMSHAALDAHEHAAWKVAVEHYRRSLAKRSPLFDPGMVEIRDRLAALASGQNPRDAALEPELIETLAAAAPIYRRHSWPEHDAANRRMIARLGAYSEHFQALADELARIYRHPWPDQPVRVDVVVDADWAGAYTTVEPTHLTLAADDPRQEGEAALEVLFHEASHGLINPVHQALTAELVRQGVKLERPDLWHALLFDTTGEIVRRRLPEGYVPYAEKQGLYRGPWARYREAIRKHWRPYVDDRASFEEAVAGVVEALKETPAR